MARTHILTKHILVEIPKIIFDRSDWVKYLVNGTLLDVDDTLLHAITGEKFNSFMHEQLTNYIFEKKNPPAEIASTVMNVADDMLSGRDPVIRAGDYIQLQNYMRQKRIL